MGVAGRTPDIGPTSETVAENVQRLRTEQNLTYTQLSERLETRAGWTITATAVRRIEEGERRVSVDDLMALAAALGVSPAALLMPHHSSPGARAVATGTFTQNASNIWNWITARNPLKGEAGQKQLFEFWMLSWPVWEHEHMADEIQRRKQRVVRAHTRKGEK